MDAVYQSNVLEHFPRGAGRRLLAECVRVMKPGAVMRVTVPDLEGIATEYLAALARTRRGDPCAIDEHEWMTVELLDQMVRNEAGGAMRPWLDECPQRAGAFVRSRIGTDAGMECHVTAVTVGKTRVEKTVNSLQKVLRVLREPYRMREFLLKRLLGKEYPALWVGRFRLSGEVHQWMYDEVSLARVMKEVGLLDVRRVRWCESRIDGWKGFKLEEDTPALRMEGVRRQ